MKMNYNDTNNGSNTATSDQLFAQYGRGEFNLDSVMEISPFPSGEFICTIADVEMAVSQKGNPQLIFKITSDNHSYREYCPIDPNATTAFKLKRIISGFGVDTTGANVSPLLIKQALIGRSSKVRFQVQEKKKMNRMSGQLEATGEMQTELKACSYVGQKEHINNLLTQGQGQMQQQGFQNQGQQGFQQTGQNFNDQSFQSQNTPTGADMLNASNMNNTMQAQEQGGFQELPF